MQASDQATSQLHQQASTQYLQGKFAEALALWKQILASDPNDERAQEGVRLCELLTDGEAVEPAPPAAEEATAPSPDFVVADEQEAVEAPIDFEVPNLEIDMSAVDAPDPSRQSDGIDLGEEPQPIDLAGEIPEAPVVEATPVEAFEAPATDLEADMPIVDGILDGNVDPAAAELQRRTQDLVQEAQAAYTAGDVENARSVLARVFILDETNAAAHELQELIEGAVPAETEIAVAADLDAPDHDSAPGQFDLGADAPEIDGQTIEMASPIETAEPEDFVAVPVEPVVPVESSEAVPEVPAYEPAEPGEAPIEDLMDDPDDVDMSGLEEEPASGERLSNAPKIKLPQLEVKSSKSRWIVIGVVVGVFAVVGVGFFMKLRSIDVRDDVPPPPIAGPSEAAPAGAQPAETTPAEAAPAENAQATAAPTEDLTALLARGASAMDSGDYAAAILAFNEVLKQDPDNFEATEKMEIATEAYKEQQETQRQWLAATTLFREGEYRSALKMFYRLPQDSEEDRVKVVRYQENGWFNMGLLALRTGNCDLALSHFTEAATIDPQDVDIEAALALCETCSNGGSRRSGFQRALSTMEIRGLDD